MRSPIIPKTIQKWIDANQDKIDEVTIERDEFGKADGHGDYSVWVYLKKGWINQGMTAHLIHESTVKDFMEHTSYIESCNCEDCQ